jgi:dolichol-phosphate mannosyltransferase
VTAGQVDGIATLGRVLVIVPTYNERDNIELIIERVTRAVSSINVLVVDDGSPDGTGKIADTLAHEDERVKVLHRSEKAGLGPAYIAGFDWGLAAGYDVLVEMDADGSHPPEQLPALLATLERADVVLGSRWVPGGRVVNWPRTREILSRGANLYTRLALGIKLGDATGGYRAYRRAVLESIDYQAVASEGYCFQVDLVWRAIEDGFRVLEVPITFTERERGESKMSGSIVREALVMVTKWGAQHRLNQLQNALRGRPGSPSRPRIRR